MNAKCGGNGRVCQALGHGTGGAVLQLTAVEDEIIWKFTADGQYTAKSAYEVQFRGSYCIFNSQRVWRAR